MARSSAHRTPTCPRCGGRLARDNRTGRCTPCQSAERDRLTTPPTLPASFWEHPPLRRALRERHFGLVIRAYRGHPYHGRRALPQHVVARWLGITQAQLSRLEHGRPIVHLDRLTHWARLLTIPAGLLWFALPDDDHHRRDDAAPLAVGTVGDATGTAGNDPDCEGDTMKRRSLVIAAGLASLGVAEPFGPMLASADSPTRIGDDHVRSVQSVIDGFERADAAMGGNELCTFAMTLHDRVSRWERECAYDRRTGHALQSVLGDLECWIGWFALDAERRPDSRRFLHEAILRARLTEDPRLEVQALASLGLLVQENNPREALHCAETARRLSAGWAPPRLKTLLHLRSAYAHAVMGDRVGFGRNMAQGHGAYELGPQEDDPQYVHHVTPIEVMGIEGHSYLNLNQPAKAATLFQKIASDPDPIYSRNQVRWSIRLASAVLKQGDVQEASRLALSTLPAATSLKSNRTAVLFSALRDGLARRARESATTREFLTSYNDAFRG